MISLHIVTFIKYHFVISLIIYCLIKSSYLVFSLSSLFLWFRLNWWQSYFLTWSLSFSCHTRVLDSLKFLIIRSWSHFICVLMHIFLYIHTVNNCWFFYWSLLCFLFFLRHRSFFNNLFNANIILKFLYSIPLKNSI